MNTQDMFKKVYLDTSNAVFAIVPRPTNTVSRYIQLPILESVGSLKSHLKQNLSIYYAEWWGDE